MMAAAASKLNLKGHRIVIPGTASADGSATPPPDSRLAALGAEEAPGVADEACSDFIHGPGDIEGHMGRDGRFYVVDTARLFPPRTPTPGARGCILYRLLRPELVRKFGRPLSSDAFSRVGGFLSSIEIFVFSVLMFWFVCPTQFASFLFAIPSRLRCLATLFLRRWGRTRARSTTPRSGRRRGSSSTT